MFSVNDKVVIVTGAARGNGKAIAEGFLKYGAVVYFFDKLKKELETTVDLSRSTKAYAVVGNVLGPADLDRLVDTAVGKNGRIDALVNNAGVTFQSEDGEDVWDKTININLKGAFLLSNRVAKIMIKQKSGSIINITSLGAEMGFSKNPSYVASKGGLKQLTKAMAYDLAPYNVRVNNICPGYMITDMTKGSYNNIDRKEIINNRIMLKRWGLPCDLVGPCIFLTSDASTYITGIDLPVDGGWLAKGV